MSSLGRFEEKGAITDQLMALLHLKRQGYVFWQAPIPGGRININWSLDRLADQWTSSKSS
jgi:hypothetical protein